MLPPMNARDTMWSPPVCAVTPATVRTELTRITAGVGGRVAAAVTASAAAVAAAAAAELGEGRSDHAIDKYGEAIRLLEAALAEVNADGEGQERSPQAANVVRLRGGHNIILHGRLTL